MKRIWNQPQAQTKALSPLANDRFDAPPSLFNSPHILVGEDTRISVDADIANWRKPVRVPSKTAFMVARHQVLCPWSLFNCKLYNCAAVL